ncbi:Uncharacterised protein [uncultured archaeon]|nr:Uncharacterised protein [uncultured archaeon]
MSSLSRNRRASVPDIILSPTFTTVIALGLVGLIILSSIYKLGSSTEFEKQIFSADIALLADSLYAVRPDVNLIIEYPAPTQFGIKIEPRLVTVYQEKPEDGKSFWYNEDKAYQFKYGAFPPKRKTPKITFFKQGNTLGVLTTNINTATPYCEIRPHQKTSARIDYPAIAGIGQQPVDVATGNVQITAQALQGNPTATLYVNSNPESAQLACQIAQALFEEFPMEGYAIIPLNPELLSPDDPRLKTAQNQNIAVFIELTLPAIDVQAKAGISQAVATGVKDFV